MFEEEKTKQKHCNTLISQNNTLTEYGQHDFSYTSIESSCRASKMDCIEFSS